MHIRELLIILQVDQNNVPGACHLADNGGSTKCPPLRGVLEIMQGLAFLNKFISGDTAKIKKISVTHCFKVLY